MALHVTQCPGCDSTFNTSAAMLESAEGKVRCGSCLTIFQAIDNFVQAQAAAESHEEDSVFVGNNPEDYFDPTHFLTRSALQQAEEYGEEPPDVITEPVSENEKEEDITHYQDEPISEESVELSEESTKEFFDAIEQSMEASLKEAESENRNLLQELHSKETAFYEDFQEPLISESENLSPELFPGGEDQLGDSIEENTEPQRSDSTESHEESDLTAEPTVPTEPIDSNENKEFASHIITETETPPAPEDLFPDSIPPEEDEELPPMDDFIAQSIAEIVPPNNTQGDETEDAQAAANDQQYLGEEGSTEAQSETAPENDPENEQANQTAPESLELKASFSFHQGFIRPSPEDEQTATEDRPEQTSEEAATETEQVEDMDSGSASIASEDSFDPEVIEEEFHEPDDEETELNQEIVEHDFKESIADGFESSESEFETAIFGDTEEDDKDDTEVVRSRALETELDDDGELESIPLENIAAMDVSSTPVQLLTGSHSSWGKRLLLGFVIIVLSGGLGSQYLWLNMTAYSQDLRIRPLYEFACAYTFCELPEYSNIGAIRSDTLEVRSHPELENGLVVNIEFRNTAAFPQAFPVMVLSFNSASNEIVALRELAPDEYLDPALREIAMMPVMSPVQVSLEIIDPGPGAVNYTLAFRLP